MKIVTLMENTPGAEGCLFEHGLSFYIETSRRKLLLDTGASAGFLENARVLGIDLRAVDTVVLSHGHNDHTGGLLAFAQINPRAKIYLHKKALGQYYSLRHPQPKAIGPDPAIAALPNLTFTEGNVDLGDGISLLSGVTGRRLWPQSNEALKKKVGQDFVQDSFDHEQSLVVEAGEKRVLLSGCAHNGILNILEAFRADYGGAPSHVITGFHTAKAEYTPADHRMLLAMAQALQQTPTLYFSGHCIGEYPLQILREWLGDRLIPFHSGQRLL